MFSKTPSKINIRAYRVVQEVRTGNLFASNLVKILLLLEGVKNVRQDLCNMFRHMFNTLLHNLGKCWNPFNAIFMLYYKNAT